MPITCKAYIVEKNYSVEFIVNLNNLSSFIQEHNNGKEIVVVGPYHYHFVLSCKGKKVNYCTNSIIKLRIEKELANKKTGLHLFQASMSGSGLQQVFIYSTSNEQAKQDLQQWTMIPFSKVVKLA